jgi:hypothetical protein
VREGAAYCLMQEGAARALPVGLGGRKEEGGRGSLAGWRQREENWAGASGTLDLCPPRGSQPKCATTAPNPLVIHSKKTLHMQDSWAAERRAWVSLPIFHHDSYLNQLFSFF